MLRKTRILVLGTMTALLAGIAAQGQHLDADRGAGTAERRMASAAVFEISWFTVDGGGGTSTGGGFVLSGTAGQPDAGDLAGGGFTLRGGFWQPGCGACPTDVSGDGITSAADLAVLLGSWGPCAPGAACECLDDNGDGLISAADLAVLLGSWGPCP